MSQRKGMQAGPNERGLPKGAAPIQLFFLWGGIGSHLNFKDVDDLSIRTGNTETVSLHAGKGAAVAENIDIGKEGMLGHGAQAAPVMVPGQFHTLYMAVVARGLPFFINDTNDDFTAFCHLTPSFLDGNGHQSPFLSCSPIRGWLP